MAETFSKSDKKNYKFIDLRNSPYPNTEKKMTKTTWHFIIIFLKTSN